MEKTIGRRTFLKYGLALGLVFAADLILPKAVKAQPEEAVEEVKEFRCPIHYFHEITNRNWFESNLYNLLSQGLYPIDLRDVEEYFSQGKKSWPDDKNPTVLTFDDGFLSQYQNACPILKQWQVKAVFAPLPDFNDGVHRYMSREQIREISQDFEIASHTLNHSDLPSLREANPGSWQAEIIQSRKWLEEIIGKEVISFAYPFGAYDWETKELVSKNYKIAVTTGGGNVLKSAERYELPRLSG